MTGEDNMTQGNHITLYGLERENNENICTLCEVGHPRAVLARIKSSGFDCEILKKMVFIREASPMSVRPRRQPFQSACSNRNYPVVRLLLELGADPDAECCAGTILKTPRKQYANNQRLQALFDGGKLWWKVEYPEEKKRTLQGALEHCVLGGEASEAVWLMTHGVRLNSPAILTSEAFGKQPRTFKELVCGMGIPNDRRQEFHAWLKRNASDADVPDIMNVVDRTGGYEGRELVGKLLLSIDLIGADRLDSLIGLTLPIPVQIGMLRCFISAYDTSEHKHFVEKAIAALFRGMLCACMEI